MIHLTRWAYSPLFIAMCYLFAVASAFAEIPTAIEPLYSEAVLSFNSGDFNRALSLIGELQKKAPSCSEILELKALVFKAKDPKRSAEVYRELINLKIAEKRPSKEIAPYLFELATLKFESKEYETAKTYFQRCVEAKYNWSASAFFLGLAYFNTNEFGKAEEAFKITSSGDLAALRPPANFYLAQCYSKMNQSGRSVQFMVSARDGAKEMKDNPAISDEHRKLCTQIYEGTSKALAPMDKSSFYGNAALMLGYDSNVLTLPDNVSSSTPSGKSTPKGTLAAGVGYTTSPLRKWQYIPSYRVSWNYNTNKNSRSAEYLAQTLSLYVTRRPLDPFNYGLKVEGTHTFQNTIDPATDSGTYRPLSLNTSMGPFARKELRSKLVWGGELLFEPNHYYTDSKQSASGKLSGIQIEARTYLQNDRGTRFANPMLYVNLLKNQTDGVDYQEFAWTVGAQNTLYLNDRLKFLASLDFGMSSYGNRTGGARNDRTLNFGLTANRKINSRLSAAVDFRYTLNRSNIRDSYQYKRYTAMAGVSYSIF